MPFPIVPAPTMPMVSIACDLLSADVLDIGNLPIDLWLACFTQGGIDLREGPAAKEAIGSRQRRGMSGLNDDMPRGVDERRFLARIRAPQHKHHPIGLVIHCADDRIREILPALALMRVG